MRLSSLVFALSIILYSAVQLGADIGVKYAWIGFIIASVIWIAESVLASPFIKKVQA